MRGRGGARRAHLGRALSGFHPRETPHPVSRRALPQLLLLLVVTSVVLSSLALAGVLPAARVATAAALEVGGDAHPLGRLLAPPPARSVIRAADGSVLAVLHGDQDRMVVPLSAVPMTVRNAVVAIEDDRFFEHGGIDPRGILRAAVADLRKGTIAQGGSTLTQQYIKKVVTGDSRTLDRKIREAMYAVELERRWSKSQILEAYLNQAYFGDGIYGIATAAQHYFGGKSVRKLTLAEAAALAATIQSPNRLKPTRPKDNKPRRMTVLDRMLERNFASARSVARAKKERLKVKAPAPDQAALLRRVHQAAAAARPGLRQGAWQGGHRAAQADGVPGRPEDLHHP